MDPECNFGEHSSIALKSVDKETTLYFSVIILLLVNHSRKTDIGKSLRLRVYFQISTSSQMVI